VGAIQLDLLEQGIDRAISVDASSAYLQVAKEEAERRGFQDQVEYHHGDFVNLAENLSGVDIVTLDRVVCCYNDMEALVQLSAQKAKRYYGLVFPRDTWWMKLMEGLLNTFYQFRNRAFRIYVHPVSELDRLVKGRGFRLAFERDSVLWEVRLYERVR
jgi:magnesium-protoporphyrin O-methyltransferase